MVAYTKLIRVTIIYIIFNRVQRSKFCENTDKYKFTKERCSFFTFEKKINKTKRMQNGGEKGSI